MTHKVSIIIPAKNEETNIGSCLDSVFAIDYPRDRYEVILVDNGSTDATVEIAERRGAKVFSVPNAKISALRNFGASQAQGQILAFLDADCTVEQDWLQKTEKYFTVENVVCFGSAPQIPAKPTWIQHTWFQVRKKREKITETQWLESMNMFVRRDVFDKIGGFNEKLITCEDVDLSYRLSEHGKILSDKNIKAVHHGEAKDLAEFFQKERWRGKSNYLGLKEHGLRMAEIPSLILPLYFLLLSFVFVFFTLSGQWSFSLGAFILWQTPLASITFFKLYRVSSFKLFLQLYFLYNVYYLARGLSVFG